MQKAAGILLYFDSLIARYPYRQLNNVQSTTMFGGMENAGNIFYDEQAIASPESIEALIAHEIAHQWFGNSVTEKSFAHLWLSEGFATFLTNYYIRSRYGEDSFTIRLNNDAQKVRQFLSRTPLPVVDHQSKFMSLLNANSYQKGGLFLEALRRTVGEEKFWKGIRNFYAAYKYKNADTNDFKTVMEDAADTSLTALFTNWLYSTHLPTLP